MANELKHSPTPWEVRENYGGLENLVFASNGQEVAACWPPNNPEPDAAYIVECVNAHERLMAEVERLRADNRWKREVLCSVLQWLTNLVVTDSIEGMDALVDNVRNAIGEEEKA